MAEQVQCAKCQRWIQAAGPQPQCPFCSAAGATIPLVGTLNLEADPLRTQAPARQPETSQTLDLEGSPGTGHSPDQMKTVARQPETSQTLDLEGSPGTGHSPDQTKTVACVPPGSAMNLSQATSKDASSVGPISFSGSTSHHKSQGAEPSAAAGSVAKPQSGQVVVPGYELLGELGRGAMGVVYKAKQVGLERLVALKMILAGAHASEKELMRFRIEAETVARIKHVNIVQVYDIGEVNGSPFFSLEFIDGGDLAARISNKHLNAAEAAHVVEKLARGMDCAHRVGVVHRDLKPANVLLARPADAGPARNLPIASLVPKVTDFGLAKKLGDDSSKTRAGTIMGTPSYMAPEQAEGRTEEIGPPADIYALGAILYDCLAGRPPFQGTTIFETLQQVKVNEPVPLRKHRPGVPRDLETICLKCLEKDASKRYLSAGDLAEDLRRFQTGEPISARPVSALERTTKWCRRRPAVAALIGLIALTILGGIAGGFLYADHEHRRAVQEASLREEAEDQRAEALRQRGIAVVQRENAEKNFKSAQKAVDEMLTRVGQERLDEEPRMKEVQRDLLERASDFYGEFLKERGDDPGIRFERGRAFMKVGQIRLVLGAHDGAQEAYRSALELFDGLVKVEPANLEYAQDQAAIRNMLANLLVEAGKLADAEKTYLSARDEYQKLVDRDPRPEFRHELATACHNRARVLKDLGRVADAQTQLRQALTLRETNVGENRASPVLRRELARSRTLESELYLAGNQPAQALPALEQSLTLFRDLVGKKGSHVDRQELALAHARLGAALETSKPKEAEGQLLEAIRVGEALTGDFPTTLDYRRDLGNSCISLGTVLLALGKRAEADQTLKRGLAIKEKLAVDYPKQPHHRADLASSLNVQAAQMLTAGRVAESEAAYIRAAELLRDLVRDFAEKPGYWKECARTLNNLGAAQQATLRTAEAEKTFREAIKCGQEMTERFKEETQGEFELARSRYLLATFLQQAGQVKEAETLHRAARAALETLSRKHEQEPDYAEILGACLNNLGDLLRLTNRLDEGLSTWADASREFARLARAFPDRPSYLREQARTLHNRGVVLAALNKLEDAETSHGVALTLRRKLASKHEKETAYRLELASSLNEMGILLARLGRAKKSEESFDEAIRIVHEANQKAGESPERWQAELIYQTNLLVVVNAVGKKDRAMACEKRMVELKGKLSKGAMK